MYVGIHEHLLARLPVNQPAIVGASKSYESFVASGVIFSRRKTISNSVESRSISGTLFQLRRIGEDS